MNSKNTIWAGLTISIVWVLVTAGASAVSNPFLSGILVMVTLYAIWGYSWQLVARYTGEISLGHSAFAALGAYSTVLLFQKLGLHPIYGWIIGVFLSIILSIVIGGISLKLKGPYFTLATLSFAAVLLSLILHFQSFTGGPNGIQVSFSTTSITDLEFLNPNVYFAIGSMFVLMLLLISLRLPKTKFGLYLQAVRANSIAAEAVGINSFVIKLMILAISAAFTAIGGILYVFSIGFADPNYLSGLTLSTYMVMVAIIGGGEYAWGPVVGAIITEMISVLSNSLSSQNGGYETGLIGLVLMAVMLFVRRGLVSLILMIPKWVNTMYANNQRGGGI